MNDILDITYCEDKYNDGGFKIANTPSKLKLRTRTYEGLTKNINKRRGKNKEFSIPDVFMPQNVYSAVQGQNVVQNAQAIPQYTTTATIKRAVINAAPKKLKTNADQIRALEKLGNSDLGTKVEQSNNFDNISAVPSNNGYNVSEPVYKSASVDTLNYEVNTKPTESQNVENQSAYQTPTVNPISNDSMIDAVREKAFETLPTSKNDYVEDATKTDEFGKLDKMTKEYNLINDEYNKSKQILEDTKAESSETKNQISSYESDLNTINNKINGHREVIDSTKKDISDIKEEMRAITEKINHKMSLIKEAKENRLREKLKLEEEASKLMDEIKENNKKIDEMKQKLAEKDKEKEALAHEEDVVLKEKNEVQNEYERKLEILKAITLPSGIEDSE